jgi:hypothetical protein
MYRWESEMVARMMGRFLITKSSYMDRNSPKTMGCTLRSTGITRRRNSEILHSFINHMWLKSQGKNEKKDTDTIMNNKT